MLIWIGYIEESKTSQPWHADLLESNFLPTWHLSQHSSIYSVVDDNKPFVLNNNLTFRFFPASLLIVFIGSTSRGCYMPHQALSLMFLHDYVHHNH